ncbi:mandelate racemase/muconate lactonizing enzyme family protein [Muricoccus radiodurans]|uniref:mandelate racemase/muconate lactonizing enzyme family protein n=1 Tax=Muricoccus radiodurans TaxID=2231721 RepID=UPI003CF5EAC0
MKITRVTATTLRSPFRYPGDGSGGNLGLRSMDTLVVRVDTDAGLTGWGEAFGFGLCETTRIALEGLVAPLCLGQDAGDIPALRLLLQRKLHNYGRNGAASFAIAGVDIALWDIAAQAACLPLHRFLGGPATQSLPTYASLLRHGDPAVVRRGVEDAIARGFGRIKLHEVDPACVRAAREAAPELPLMVDMNCPFTVEDALAFADAVRPLSPAWIEEPVWPPEDAPALRRLRASCGLPVAAGECEGTVEGLRRLIDGAVDVIQPSVTKIGVSGMLEVAALAREAGVTVAPHSPYFGPGLLATAHLIATWDGDAALEWYDATLERPPFDMSFLPVAGRIALPQGPGLGLTPRQDAAG